MDALTLLTSRHSQKKLTEPAPNKAQLEKLFQAALRVPDHGKLQPYRFVVIEKEKLNTLKELFKCAVQELELGEEQLKKAENLPSRAPMIIAVIAKIQRNIAKVPVWEQIITAGCATYAMQLAANAQGFDNVWITGPWVQGLALRKALHCDIDDQIVALLMIGSSNEDKLRPPKNFNYEEFVDYL